MDREYIKIVLFIILVLVGIVLFVAHRKRWISSRTFNAWVGIATLISMVAAVLVFVMPSPKSSKESTPGLLLNALPLNTVAEETQAILVGEITDDGGDLNLEVWFQYGKTRSYSLESPHHLIRGIGIFSVSIDNLEPCTRYYYRVVGRNSAGTSYGENKTFTTKCPPKR